MRQRIGQAARRSVLFALLVAVTFAGAACGAVGTPHSVRSPSASVRSPSARTAGAPGPPSGSRALARQTSDRLLRHLVLPPGARPDRSRRLPKSIRNAPEQVGSRHLVARHEIFAFSRPPVWVYRYIRRHVRAGLTFGGDGSSGSYRMVAWSPRPLPTGLQEALLEVTVIPAGQGALVRADTQVQWYPPRNQTEYIDAARFSAVRLWSHMLNPRPHTVRRVITSPAIIARLARALNLLPAGQGLTFTCIAVTADYLITFVPGTTSQPAIEAAPNGCDSVFMYVGGKRQPALVGSFSTIGLINRLLGITKAHTPAASH